LVKPAGLKKARDPGSNELFRKKLKQKTKALKIPAGAPSCNANSLSVNY